MDAHGAIRNGLQSADMISQAYLSDLTDAEMLIRAVPGINHIAWQLGHLLKSEFDMVNGICPGAIAPLPAGFAEAHSKSTATDDDPTHFLSKAEYLQIAAAQRAGALAALAKLSAEDLDKPAPESMREYAPTFGDVFIVIGNHWLMHAGQWAVLRRKVGRPPMF